MLSSYYKGVYNTMKNNKKLLSTIILSLIIAISSIYLVLNFKERSDTRQSQLEIQNVASTVVNLVENEPRETQENESDEIIESPKILALREEFQNEDIVGYLEIEDTTINYPVLHFEDNDFYLNHNIYKEPSQAGSIFLDYENDIEVLDYNTVIYGHNMREDIMFHSLRYYENENFYNDNKYVKFTTLYNEYVYEIFSAYETDIYFPYIYVIFESDEKFYELSKQFKEKSLYETNVDITSDDKILTLSTCTSSPLTPNNRFVVQGKLISINGEPYLK